jgi:hypothetical protein
LKPYPLLSAFTLAFNESQGEHSGFITIPFDSDANILWREAAPETQLFVNQRMIKPHEIQICSLARYLSLSCEAIDDLSIGSLKLKDVLGHA